MIRRPTFARLCTASGPGGGAGADGPLRLAMEQKLDATPEAVWAAIGDFQDLLWLPGIVSQTGEGGNTPGEATRVLHVGPDGAATIHETLMAYDAAGRSYSYRITEVDPKVLPVTAYASTLTVADDGGKARVEWKAGFRRGDPNDNPPAGMSDEAATGAVTGIYRAGLDALAGRFGKRE